MVEWSGSPSSKRFPLRASHPLAVQAKETTLEPKKETTLKYKDGSLATKCLTTPVHKQTNFKKTGTSSICAGDVFIADSPDTWEHQSELAQSVTSSSPASLLTAQIFRPRCNVQQPSEGWNALHLPSVRKFRFTPSDPNDLEWRP